MPVGTACCSDLPLESVDRQIAASFQRRQAGHRADDNCDPEKVACRQKRCPKGWHFDLLRDLRGYPKSRSSPSQLRERLSVKFPYLTGQIHPEGNTVAFILLSLTRSRTLLEQDHKRPCAGRTPVVCQHRKVDFCHIPLSSILVPNRIIYNPVTCSCLGLLRTVCPYFCEPLPNSLTYQSSENSVFLYPHHTPVISLLLECFPSCFHLSLTV